MLTIILFKKTKILITDIKMKWPNNKLAIFGKSLKKKWIKLADEIKFFYYSIIIFESNINKYIFEL